MILWLEVSKDKYQLPLAVADTASELAKMRGYKDRNYIYQYIWKQAHWGLKERFVKVEVEDEY